MSTSQHPFSTETSVVNNEEYNNLIHELNQEISQNQPQDLLQFCATFFLKKLQLEREESRHPQQQFYHDPHPLCRCLLPH